MLVVSAGYNTKISEIKKKVAGHNHDKYITTPEFNKLSAEAFAPILKISKFSNKDRFWWQT